MSSYLTLAGLLLNFVGTVMIAFSFGKNRGGAYQEDKKGREVYLASFLYPLMFRSGLTILAAGFALQVAAEFGTFLSTEPS